MNGTLTLTRTAVTIAIMVMVLVVSESFCAVKNIIVMVPDGCARSVQTLGRWYKGGPLTLDSMVTGAVKINMANSISTGSAAAATAFATGYKTTVRFLGIGPREDDVLAGFTMPRPAGEWSYRPLATVLEAAKAQGKSVGLVSTSRITHATPAAFGAHVQDRGLDNEIMEHLVYQNIDVVFGGGSRHLLPESEGGKRTDGENLLDVLIDRGYQYVTTRKDLLRAKAANNKIWGLFAESHMDAHIDRPLYHPDEPSIAEMTAKAIEILSRNPEGFFLLVEGSQVDWAGHNNDPVYMVTDFLAFDEAVGQAVAFADNNAETKIVAFADHNTGGMAIGNYNTSYKDLTVDELVGPLKRMDRTCCAVLEEAGGDSASDKSIIEAFKKHWDIELTAEEIAQIRIFAKEQGLCYAAARVISANHTDIGWTTHGHTAEDVPLWSYGAGKMTGLVDNTDIARDIFSDLGVDSDSLNHRLFVDISTTDLKGALSLDTTDVNNPVLRGCESGTCVELPIGKDLLYSTREGKTTESRLGGLVVYAPATSRVYVPRQALVRIKTIFGL